MEAIDANAAGWLIGTANLDMLFDDLFDKDGSGLIDKTEFEGAAADLGLFNDEAEVLFYIYDNDQRTRTISRQSFVDGTNDVMSFYALLLSLQVYSEVFRLSALL